MPALLVLVLSVGVLGGCVADDPVEIDEVVLGLELDACRPGVGTRATAVSIGGGLALTAAHPFDEVEAVEVVGTDGSRAPGEIAAIDRDRDIAVVAFDPEAFAAPVRTGITLATDPDLDDTTVVVALLGEDGARLQPAEVLRRANVRLDGVGRRAALELATAIEPGDSGAPVISDDGEILGLVFATSRRDERGWAVAASELFGLVDDARRGEAVPAEGRLTCS